MAYTTGEYIDKFILPQLVKVLRNTKTDYMHVIPNAPKKAISTGGIVTNKLNETIEVDWNKTDKYQEADIKKFSIENATISWDYLSTTPFSVDKEEARESAFDRKGTLFVSSRDAITESWTAKTLHNIAPADDTSDVMPVLKTTGADRGDGSKRLTIIDLILWREKFNKLGLKSQDLIYVVLCPEHLTDLTIDSLNYQNFKDIYINTKNGEPVPQYGLKFFWNQETVYYGADGVKKAPGSALIATDKPSSIAIYSPHTIKALEKLTSHFKPMSEDVENNPPEDKGRFTGNAVGASTFNYGHGAMISGTV